MEESLLTNICRACMTEEAKFQSIFVPDECTGLSIHLAEMIMAYASVQITLGDGLPEQICIDCAKKVSDLYIFKLKCEETDKSLRCKLGKSPLLQPYSILDEQQQYNTAFDLENKDSENVIVKPEIYIETPKEETEIDSYDDVYDVDETNEIFKQKTCDVCDKCFDSAESLDLHQKEHDLNDDSFTVIEAENVITESVPIENFFEVKTLLEFKCDVCELVFDNVETYESHMADHNKEDSKETFSCEICKKGFNKNSHLTRHMKIHAAVKPFNCTECNKGFVRAEQLTHHMNIHSGIKPHVCKICSKGFNQISNLKDHMRTHNGEKPFLCSTCGKGFNQLGNLRQHTVRHSGIKAHLCSVCGNGFASKGELCAHLRKHTGARPFVCNICNHGFTTSSSLTKHKRIHSGEKPYECEVCKMKFSRSGILARHKRTHTGEKPYVCKFCSKAFSQSNDLSSHLRIHTGEKPFICDVCGQAFRQSSALKTHKKTHVEKNAGSLDTRFVISMMHHTSLLNTLQ